MFQRGESLCIAEHIVTKLQHLKLFQMLFVEWKVEVS